MVDGDEVRITRLLVIYAAMATARQVVRDVQNITAAIAAGYRRARG